MNKKKVGNKIPQAKKTIVVKFNKWLLAILIIVGFAAFYNSLNNKFLTSWDDNIYVIDNPDVKALHGDSLGSTLKNLFTGYVTGNYHPLTMLSYSIEYGMFKLNPTPYHFTNLLFHLLNIVLVFYLIWLLTKQQWTAFITALLFAIHPMHVESVAWISERKDVLYAFFYLAALCMYVKYLKEEKKKRQHYFLVLILFIASVLSKGMAVSFPIVLFIIDYFQGRKFDRQSLLEKVPFLLVSGIFGYVAILAQRSANATDDLSMLTVNLGDKILFACYGIVMYLWKLIAPIHLSPHYPLPDKQGGALPTLFYLSPLIVLAIAFVIYKSKRYGKDVLFGFGFFLITVMLVLQLLPVGNIILAERYSYLPYIGIFFIVARLVNKTIENKSGKYNSWRTPSIAALVIFTVFCFYTTTQRCKIWENDFTMWSDAIEEFNNNSFAYNSRGDAYFFSNQYENAIVDYNRAIELKNNHPYYNRGQAYYKLKKYDEALKDFSKTVELNPAFARGYSMRAILYTDANKFDEALSDYSKALQYQPDNSIAYHNRGILYKKNNKFPEALENFNSAIQINSNYAEAYNNRAIVYRNLQKNDEALKDFNKAIELQPDFARPYYYRGMLFYDSGNKQKACEDIQKAASLGFQSAVESLNKLCR